MTLPMPEWWLRLAERAQEPPLRPRRPLRIESAALPIGSIEPRLAYHLRAAHLPLRLHEGVEVLTGAPDAALAEIARWMNVQGLGGPWRDELLAVTDEEGTRHAVIERAAVRPLGIATFAVHLIGFTPQGHVWVQQRALDKATDPGLWDTLMGGMVAANETPDSALERETWEEAGLRIAELQALQAVGRISVRRPVRQGYMVEHSDVFEALIPAALTPVNQDGEVERFECLSPESLVERMADGQFTLEAALMLAESLRRRGFA
jgi:8-oxo-dGTP pyrophosphatase MutT (NUDIX family)